MGALTTIYNPSGSENTQVHLYHNTENKNVGLQFRSEKSPKDVGDNALVASKDSQPGFVNTLSHLASTKFNGMELIFGVTEQKSASINSAAAADSNPPDEKPIDISLVSPVYQIMDSTNEKNYKVAACASDDNAWVFYLTTTANKQLRIKESVIGTANPAKYNNTNEILPGSALAAYYVPQKSTRYVIYQALEDSLLREFKVGGSDSPIDNSSDAKDQCTFAVTTTDTTVYLYYVNDHDTLRKITKPIGDEWGSSSKVSGADSKVDPDSQVTVCSANGYNHIFYKAVDQSSKTKFFHVMDKQ